MAAAVRLREDYDAAGLRELAKRSADAAQTRYFGSSTASRWVCRGSMREARIASTFSSGSSAVAKLRRLSRKRLNSSYSSGPPPRVFNQVLYAFVACYRAGKISLASRE